MVYERPLGRIGRSARVELRSRKARTAIDSRDGDVRRARLPLAGRVPRGAQPGGVSVVIDDTLRQPITVTTTQLLRRTDTHAHTRTHTHTHTPRIGVSLCMLL